MGHVRYTCSVNGTYSGWGIHPIAPMTHLCVPGVLVSTPGYGDRPYELTRLLASTETGVPHPYGRTAYTRRAYTLPILHRAGIPALCNVGHHEQANEKLILAQAGERAKWRTSHDMP